MSVADGSHTSDHVLARAIAAELTKLGMLPPDRAEEFISNLERGTARESDWNGWALASLRPPQVEDRP